MGEGSLSTLPRLTLLVKTSAAFQQSIIVAGRPVSLAAVMLPVVVGADIQGIYNRCTANACDD